MVALPPLPLSLTPSLSPSQHPSSFISAPSSLLKGQMSSMEICKSVEVYSVTRLYPPSLATAPHNHSVPFYSCRRKKPKRREKRREPWVCFSLEHILKSVSFFRPSLFFPKAFFLWKIAAWTDGRAEVCVDFFFFFLSTINRPWIHTCTHTCTHCGGCLAWT